MSKSAENLILSHGEKELRTELAALSDKLFELLLLVPSEAIKIVSVEGFVQEVASTDYTNVANEIRLALDAILDQYQQIPVQTSIEVLQGVYLELFEASQIEKTEHNGKRKQQSKLVVLAINVPDTLEVIADMAKHFGWDSMVVLKDELAITSKRYDVAVTSTLILLDSQGIVQARIVGEHPWETTEKILHKVLSL